MKKPLILLKDMMSLCYKLGLNVPTMLSTINTKFAARIESVHVISHNVADLTQLFQRAELFEQIQSWTTAAS
jgi:hypothetical protein